MKNVVRIMLAFSILLVPCHVHSIQSAALLKIFLNRTGTVLGTGLATVPWLIFSCRNAYNHTRDGIEALKISMPDREFRKPTIEEDYFLRKNAGIQDSTKIYIAKDIASCNGFAGISFNDTIVIPERLPGFEKTLSQAIQEEDFDHASHFISVAQHEEGHKKEKHSLKATAVAGISSTFLTPVIAKTCKTIMPYNPQASLIMHAMRCIGKTLGGHVLFYAYQKVYFTYGKYNEFQADQHVQPQYRPYLIDVLKRAEYVENFMKQRGNIKELPAWREWILNDHPTIRQRSDAFGFELIRLRQDGDGCAVTFDPENVFVAPTVGC